MSKTLTTIQRAAQREKSAMLALYEQQKHRVYFLCLQMLPEEDAEAAAAESFHTLWKKLFRDQNLAQPQLELYLALITARLCRERLLEESPMPWIAVRLLKVRRTWTLPLWSRCFRRCPPVSGCSFSCTPWRS